MPTYTFRNKVTGVTSNHILTLKQREEYLEQNPNEQQMILNSTLVSGVGGLKPSDGFKDVLNTIKKNNPRSTINT